MKDDREHIDQLFESLNDRQFDIPEAFLKDLNKRLDEKPKRKHYFFFWFTASFVLIGAIGIFYLTNKYEANTRKNKANELTAKNKFKESLNSTADSVTIPSAKDILATKMGQPGKDQSAMSENVAESQTSVKIKQSQTKQFPRKLKTTNKESHPEIHTDRQTKKVKSKVNGIHQKLVGLKTPKSKMKSNNPPKTESEKGKTIQITAPDKGNKSLTVKPEDTKLAEEVPTVEKDSAITQITIDTVQKPNSNLVEQNETKAKSSDSKWKKEIMLFAGLGGNTIHDSQKNSEYIEKIKENQTSILAPSFGISTNLSYTKFTFGSGIHFEQTGEKFKVDLYSSELKDSTYSEFIQDTIWVQDTLGNWIPTIHDTTIYHTVQYMDYSWKSHSVQNRYSWISVPVHFGYRFGLGNYELIPRIGAVFNFGIAQRTGTYPDSSFNNTVQYPLTKFTISYLIQLEARRKFGKWFVFVNPYFRSMINPAVSTEIIRRRYSSWGVQAGIGLNF